MAGPVAYGAGVNKKSSEKKADKEAKAAVTEKINTSMSASEPNKKDKGPDRSSLNTVRDYYYDGKVDKAESLLDKILFANPGYMEALDFKNKILELKDKIQTFKISTADEYMLESESALRDGNFYEGLLFYKKAVGLVPEMNDTRNYNFIMADLKAQSLKYAPEDRNKFIDSVEAFRDGNFQKAQKILYSLSDKYNSLKFFRGLMDVYQLTYSNEKRTKPLYNKALKYFKSGMFEAAGASLGEALAMDPKNPEYVFLMEQIKLELR
jgi:tetratricopeptide (TPR) repeat protein